MLFYIGKVNKHRRRRNIWLDQYWATHADCHVPADQAFDLQRSDRIVNHLLRFFHKGNLRSLYSGAGDRMRLMYISVPIDTVCEDLPCLKIHSRANTTAGMQIIHNGFAPAEFHCRTEDVRMLSFFGYAFLG